MRKLLAALLILLILPSAYAVNLEKLGQVGLDKAGALGFEKLTQAAGENGNYVSMLFGVISGDITGTATNLILAEAGKTNPDIGELQTLIESVSNPLNTAQQAVLKEAIKSLNPDQAKTLQLVQQLKDNQPFFDAIFDNGQKGTMGIAENGDLTIKDDTGNVIFKLPAGTEVAQDPKNKNKFTYSKIDGAVQLRDKTLTGVTEFTQELLNDNGLERITFNAKNAQYADRADREVLPITKGTNVKSLTGPTTLVTRSIPNSRGGKTTEILSLESTIGSYQPTTIINGKQYSRFSAGDKIAYYKGERNSQLTFTRSPSNKETVFLEHGVEISGSFTATLNPEENLQQLTIAPNGNAVLDRSMAIAPDETFNPDRTLFTFSAKTENQLRLNFADQESCTTCDATITDGKIIIGEHEYKPLNIVKQVKLANGNILDQYELINPSKAVITAGTLEMQENIAFAKDGAGNLLTQGDVFYFEDGTLRGHLKKQESDLTEPRVITASILPLPSKPIEDTDTLVRSIAVSFYQEDSETHQLKPRFAVIKNRRTLDPPYVSFYDLEEKKSDEAPREDTISTEESIVATPAAPETQALTKVALIQKEQRKTTSADQSISLSNVQSCRSSTSKLPQGVDTYDSLIKDVANPYGDPAVLKAFTITESDAKTLARNPSGAFGLTQIIPSTAADLFIGQTAKYCEKKFGTKYALTDDQVSAIKADPKNAQLLLNDPKTALDRGYCYYKYSEAVLEKRGVLKDGDSELYRLQKTSQAYLAGPFSKSITRDSTPGYARTHVNCVTAYYKALQPETSDFGTSGTALASAGTPPQT